jgi:hypothetical protein
LITTSPNYPENLSNSIAMARLSNLPKNTLLRNMPEKDKLRKAIQFLKANPEETPATAACAYCIQNEDTVRKVWQRERKKMGAVRV